MKSYFNLLNIEDLNYLHYVLLIFVFLQIENICAQNNEQSISITRAIDSLEAGKYKNVTSILENSIKNEKLTDVELNQAKMLLEIAYFKNGNLKFNLFQLENAVNHIKCDNPYNIYGYNTLVTIYKNLKDYKNGLYWGRKGLTQFCKIKNNVYYAELLDEVGTCYSSLKNYKVAIEYECKAIQIIDKYYEGKHRSYCFWLQSIGTSYSKLGDYNKSITYELMALKRNPIFKYFSYLSLSESYQKIGDTIKSNEYQAKSKNEINFKKTFKLFYEKENKDALVKEIDVDYKKLIENQEEKILKSKGTYGVNNKTYASLLERQSFYYYKLNDYENAIKYLLNAILIYSKIGLDNECLTASCSLSLYYSKCGKLAEAMNVGLKNIETLQEKIGITDNERISSLHKIDMFSVHILIDSTYRDLAISLHNMAYLNAELGLYLKAIELENEAILILDKVGERGNYENTRPLELISSYYFLHNDFVESAKSIRKVFNFRIKYINYKYKFYGEKEREVFWSNKKYFFETTIPSLSVKYIQHTDSITGLFYDNTLFTKGLLLNNFLQIKNAILQSGDTTLIYSWDKLCELNRQIDILQKKTLTEQTGLPQLEEDAANLDKELTKKSLLYKQSKNALQVKWQDVQKALKDNEAAIEFVSFNYYNKHLTDSTLYYALVLKKNAIYPELIPLFEQRQLDSLFTASVDVNQLYKYRLSNSADSIATKEIGYGENLYNLVWKPLEASLEDIKHIYYSPTGGLHKVSFAALPVDSSHLLSDKYDLHQVTSTREVITCDNQIQQTMKAALFGGIQYELTDTLAQHILPSEITTITSMRSVFEPDSTTMRSAGFRYLRGTLDEVNAINRNFSTFGFRSLLYTGISANEVNFKKLSGTNINIIHIATHGFFFPVRKTKQDDFRFMSLDEDRRNVLSHNPLLRSGLALAGANKTWKGDSIPDNWEDGILTSQEISQLNLTKTKLVVLSACETGLGDVKGSEGVFGLQRAFKMAGVQTMIMSLWKVPDTETSLMMQSFYKYWLSGIVIHEAFKKAQNEIRAQNPNPFYWAAFVMVD